MRFWRRHRGSGITREVWDLFTQCPYERVAAMLARVYPERSVWWCQWEAFKYVNALRAGCTNVRLP